MAARIGCGDTPGRRSARAVAGARQGRWLDAANVGQRPVVPDGYVLTVGAQSLGEVTISGRRGAAPAGSGQLVWQEGGVTYPVDTES